MRERQAWVFFVIRLDSARARTGESLGPLDAVVCMAVVVRSMGVGRIERVLSRVCFFVRRGRSVGRSVVSVVSVVSGGRRVDRVRRSVDGVRRSTESTTRRLARH